LTHGIGPSSSIKAFLDSLTKKGILFKIIDGPYRFSDTFIVRKKISIDRQEVYALKCTHKGGAFMEISAAKFRSNCFKIIDEVVKTHKEIIITKRGKPVAKLVHYKNNGEIDPLLGILAGSGRTVGDLTEPFDAEWELD
jgi:prevent-host-death family protein